MTDPNNYEPMPPLPLPTVRNHPVEGGPTSVPAGVGVVDQGTHMLALEGVVGENNESFGDDLADESFGNDVASSAGVVTATVSTEDDDCLKDPSANESSDLPQPSVAAAEPTPKKAKTGKKKLSTEEKAAKKSRRVEWAKSMKLSHVVLTDDEKDVAMLGNVEWKEVQAEYRQMFMKANNISIPMSLRLKEDLGKAIANHISAGTFKSNVTAQNRVVAKKKNHATKPVFINVEGTYYRAVNVLSRPKGRPSFMETRKSHDKDDQDTRRAKQVAWDNLSGTEGYSSDDKDLLILATDAQGALIGFAVAENVCETFDKLSGVEFKELIYHICWVYRAARNKQRLSGNHKPFASYCTGMPWLLYFHEVLMNIGIRELTTCVYPELKEEIKRTSDTVHKPIGRRSKKKAASRRSTPAYDSDIDDPPSSFKSQKNAAVHAAEMAANAVGDRQSDLNRNESFDRLMLVKSAVAQLRVKVAKLDRRYAEAKQKKKTLAFDHDENTYANLKSVRKMRKIELKDYEIEYLQLKKSCPGYESPKLSESSDSDPE